MARYLGFLTTSAAVLTLISTGVGVRMTAEENGRDPAPGTGWRERLAARYRAHPRLLRLQAGCLLGAALLFLAEPVIWLS